MRAPRVGNRVHIQRDETIYRSKGTWPQFRGHIGTVIAVNRDRERPHLTEYGVTFGAVRARDHGALHGTDVTTWFKAYEMAVLAPGCHAKPRNSTSTGDATGPGPQRQQTGLW